MNPFASRDFRTVALMLIVAGLLVLALGGYLSPLFHGTLNPLVAAQTWLSSRFMAVYEFVTVPRDVASLRQRNAELEVQVAGLQTQVIELQQKISEAEVLYSLLDFARERPENRYVAAAVIGRDPNPFMQYIFIDHGSDYGLRHGMPVVTQQGLVGRIDAVTASAARVQLITDPAMHVNVRLKSSKAEAILMGSVSREIFLDLLPRDVIVDTGEVILTSGLGGSYPENLFVGQVAAVKDVEGGLFKSVAVQPVVDFASLKSVLVITSFQPIDITPLEPTPAP